MILRAAASSFSEAGYLGTSLEDICRGSGIAKPTLYHHFPSKAAILFEVLSDYLELIIGLAEAPERLRLSPPDQLLEAMKDMIASLESRRGEVKCINDGEVAHLPAPMRKRITKREKYYGEHLDRILVAGRDGGYFTFEYLSLARLSIQGVCGWAYNWYVPGGPVDADEIAARLWRLILSGIQST
jgi:AcrR family transcriptional regulator